jgi:hypothetical protein
MAQDTGRRGDREADGLEDFLRMMFPQAKVKPIKRTFGVWYPDGDIPH